jgi:hypothetical protein
MTVNNLVQQGLAFSPKLARLWEFYQPENQIEASQFMLFLAKSLANHAAGAIAGHGQFEDTLGNHQP